MYQILLIIFGSIVGSTHIVAFLLLAAVVGWIFAVKILGKQFNQLTTEQVATAQETKKEDAILST